MNQPPLGLTPTKIWLTQRVQEIDKAIQRFQKSHYDIPDEWYRERNEIIKWIIL